MTDYTETFSETTDTAAAQEFPETANATSENISQKATESDAEASDETPEAPKGVNISPEQLSDMLHKAYMRGRNENIEARIDTDCQTRPQRSVAGELLVKGITGVAKAIFNPGRRSIWPKRRG